MSGIEGAIAPYGADQELYLMTGSIERYAGPIAKTGSEALEGMKRISGEMFRPDSLRRIKSYFAKVNRGMLTPEIKQLFETENAALKVLLKRFVPASETENHLFRMTVSGGEVFQTLPTAFFKFGAHRANASASIETLMWKVSKIMGFERHFVRTKKIELLLNDNEDPLVGSMQSEAVGPLLGDLFKEEDYLLKEVEDHELNAAILASIVLGMFDAHADNIIVDSNGRIKFFDNARCLPNSNSLLNWDGGDCLMSSYRCALLNLHERVTKKLSPQQRGVLLEKAKICLKQVDTLRDYLGNGDGKKLLNQLPKDWINTGPMLEAMRERIELAIKCLSSKNEVDLLELAIRANPSYMIVFAISFMNALIKLEDPVSREDMIRYAHRHHCKINSVSLDLCFRTFRNRQYDLSHLLQMCRDAPDFTHLVERLIDYHIEVGEGRTAYTYKESYETEQSFYRSAVLDSKDTL